MVDKAGEKKLFSLKMLDWTFLIQYVRASTIIFTENTRRSWYKKAPLTQL